MYKLSRIIFSLLLLKQIVQNRIIGYNVIISYRTWHGHRFVPHTLPFLLYDKDFIKYWGYMVPFVLKELTLQCGPQTDTKWLCEVLVLGQQCARGGTEVQPRRD